MVVEGNLDKNVENSQVPEVEPVPLTVEARSPNHWTAREPPVINSGFLLSNINSILPETLEGHRKGPVGLYIRRRINTLLSNDTPSLLGCGICSVFSNTT